MEKDNNKVSPNMEMYLETILLLSKANGEARVTDIAGEMRVAKSSVHISMHTLSDRGYLTQAKYGAVTLTDAGRKYAEDIYGRHEVLTRFFETVVGVDKAVAESDACAIEHVISAESVEKIKSILEKKK